jgi:fumarate hydratase, class II
MVSAATRPPKKLGSSASKNPQAVFRQESDALGQINVPAERLWGAQTQRALTYFSIGEDRMPKAIYHAYGYAKKAAAIVNQHEGKLPADKAMQIIKAAEEVIAGKLDQEFPLSVWQTSSGIQTDSNINEVIANRANQLSGKILGSNEPLHSIDDVNLSQSVDDTFPIAMHIATVLEVSHHLIPNAVALADAIQNKTQTINDAKVLHAWSGYANQIKDAVQLIRQSLKNLYKLPHVNSSFSAKLIKEITQLTGQAFETGRCKLSVHGSLDAMVACSGTLRSLGVALMKIVNGLRWTVGSTSNLQAQEINPGQAESLMMICIQVIANDNAVAMASSHGNFEIKGMLPIVVKNVLHSSIILGAGCEKFRMHYVENMHSQVQLQNKIHDSLKLMSLLTPLIGYDKAAIIAQKVLNHNQGLGETIIGNGLQ